MTGRPSTAAQPLLFAMSASASFGKRVADALGTPLSPHEERDFEDGEHKARPLVNIRGRDVYVLQSLYSDLQQGVAEKLCRLLFFIGALQDASAASVTAVVPYMGYARKDRKTQPRDPVTTRYVAAMFEAVGATRVVTLDVHNLSAFQNAFRCRTDHLESRRLFADALAPEIGTSDVVVVSPDAGGMKRAERLRSALAARLGREIGIAFMEKQRSLGKVSGSALIGKVAGCTAVIVDDLISTGGTLSRAARACRDAGAAHVHAAAAHGLFVGDAHQILNDQALDRILITDTVAAFRLRDGQLGGRLSVVSAAPIFAQAIQRIHNGGSLVELVE